MKMIVNVPETQIQQITPGLTAKIMVQALHNKEYEGTVTRIGTRALEALTFPVEIKISNASKELKAGMFGTATFEFPSNKALVIKRNMLVGGIKNPQVYILKDSTAVLKNIAIGQRNDNYIEVVSGINEGDLIITSGQINLTDGAKVGVQE